MASPRAHGNGYGVHHENLTILETDTSASEYSRSERPSDDVSTAYLPANVYGQSLAARTHDDGHVHYYDGDYEYQYDEDRTPKEDPLAVSGGPNIRAAPLSSIIHGLAKDRFALYANYTSLGVAQALIQTLIYPFLKIYLNMDEYRAASAELVVALPWSFKILAALVSDCVPIRGRRRVPYMYGGWAMCALFALVVACIPSETPYLKGGKVANGEAAHAGGKYVALYFMVSLGLVIADVACDGVVVELSHREAESHRGGVLLTALMARYTGHAGMTFLVALLCNSEAFGGEFGWGASPNAMSLFVVAAAVVAVGMTRLYMVEEVRHGRAPPNYRYHASRASTIMGDDAAAATTAAAARRVSCERQRRSSVIRAQRQTLWTFLQRRATLQVLVYVFLARVCFSYYASTTKVLYETWLSVSPLLSNMFNVINSLVFVGVAVLLKRSHLLTSWRRVVQGAVVVSIVITIVPLVFIATDVVRSSVLTLVVEQLVAFVEAAAYYAIVLAMLEATEPNGLEASSLALFTSIANAAIPFATSLSQSVGSHFDAYDSEWASDTSAVRWKFVYVFLAWILFRILNLALLPLLPAQKREMHKLKELGGSHRLAALYIGAAAAFVLLWVPFTTLLSALEATSCLTIAGGEGC